MEANQILRSDPLDILFEGRNKDYGAYALRKSYQRRLLTAMASVASLILLLIAAYHFSERFGHKLVEPPQGPVVELAAVPTAKKQDPPLPLPPKPQAAAAHPVQTVRLTTTRIVPDDQVKPDEHPPDQSKVDEARIGTSNSSGPADDGIEAPKANGDGGKGVLTEPAANNEDDGIFRKVEIESTYSAGDAGWLRFLNKNLRYPEAAQENGIQGTVMVQFIVDKEGNVSDVEVISGPTGGGLREEAIRVIRKSGKWIPAIQNGRPVRSYKLEPIVFQMVSEP